MRERKKRLVWAERARVRLDFVTFLVSSFSYCKAGRFILCANRKRSSLRNLQDKTVLSIKTTGILDKLDSIGFSIIRSSYCFLLFIVSFRRCDVNITSFDCDKMVYFLEPMIKDCRQKFLFTGLTFSTLDSFLTWGEIRVLKRDLKLIKTK